MSELTRGKKDQFRRKARGSLAGRPNSAFWKFARLGVALISASKNAWISRLRNENGAILAHTLRLRRGGLIRPGRYLADLIGGKGGTRTLDPGIMSAVL